MSVYFFSLGLCMDTSALKNNNEQDSSTFPRLENYDLSFIDINHTIKASSGNLDSMRLPSDSLPSHVQWE